MERGCDRCGKSYVAKTSRSRFCSVKCRTAATRARQRGLPESIAPAQRSSVDEPAGEGPQELATRMQLELAERFKSPLGQACMALARRIDSRTDNGSGLSSLVRELRVTLDAALEGAARSADELDELGAKRLERARRAGVN